MRSQYVVPFPVRWAFTLGAVGLLSHLAGAVVRGDAVVVRTASEDWGSLVIVVGITLLSWAWRRDRRA